VAAPTTSLPEKLGGAELGFTALLLRMLPHAAGADDSAIPRKPLPGIIGYLRAVAGSPANMQIMYGIMGQRRLLNGRPAGLTGYEGATAGSGRNAAHAQLQLDVYGELIDAFHQSRVAELKLDDGTWIWNAPCLSIWRKSGTSRITASGRRRGDGRHYVSSKVMTWVAFDRAIKSAEQFGFKAPLDQWRNLRDTICRDVCERVLIPGRIALSNRMGSQLLDASILMLPAVGFLPASTRAFAAPSRLSKNT